MATKEQPRRKAPKAKPEKAMWLWPFPSPAHGKRGMTYAVRFGSDGKPEEVKWTDIGEQPPKATKPKAK